MDVNKRKVIFGEESVRKWGRKRDIKINFNEKSLTM